MGIKQTFESVKLALGISIAATGAQACATDQVEPQTAADAAPMYDPQMEEGMVFKDSGRNDSVMAEKMERAQSELERKYEAPKEFKTSHAADERHRRESASSEEVSR